MEKNPLWKRKASHLCSPNIFLGKSKEKQKNEAMWKGTFKNGVKFHRENKHAKIPLLMHAAFYFSLMLLISLASFLENLFLHTRT